MDDCLMIAVLYLIKSIKKKIFLELISNTKTFNIKFCSMKLSKIKILTNLQETRQKRGLDNVEYGND